MTTIERVKQLMKKNGLETNNELLVINIVLIYTAGQIDLLKEQLEEDK